MSVTKEDLVDLALTVTGISRDRWDALLGEMRSDAQMNLRMKQEWFSEARDSEQAIREYYRKSDIWFLNTFYHGLGALLSMANGTAGGFSGWLQRFAADVSASAPVLDYGGGFFKDTWPLVMAGYRVDVAEVRGPVTDFLRRFIEMTSLSGRARVVEVDSATPITDMYGGIACFETLEHLLHPEALTAHLHSHLKLGGLFAFSATFGAPDHAPYHVASNAPLGNEATWAEIMRKIGFVKYWVDPNGGGQKIWRAAT